MDHAAQPLQRRQCLQRPPDAASSSAHTASSKPGRPTAAEQQEALSVIERMKETGEPPIVARRGQPPKPNVVACAIALYCGESFDSFDDAMRQFGVPRGTDVRGLWVEGKLLQFVEAGGMLPRPPKTTGTAKAAPATFAVAPKAAAQMVPSMAGASVAPTKADGTVTRETAADGTLQMGPARMGPPLMGLPLIEPRWQARAPLLQMQTPNKSSHMQPPREWQHPSVQVCHQRHTCAGRQIAASTIKWSRCWAGRRWTVSPQVPQVEVQLAAECGQLSQPQVGRRGGSG